MITDQNDKDLFLTKSLLLSSNLMKFLLPNASQTKLRIKQNVEYEYMLKSEQTNFRHFYMKTILLLYKKYRKTYKSVVNKVLYNTKKLQ